MGTQGFSWTIWSGILGILFFLILLGVLNIVSNNVASVVFLSVVEFLNQNLLLILLISVILLLGNIFEIFIFPFNMFYPLFNAIGGVLWVDFIFKIFKLISSFIDVNIYLIFLPFYLLALILVPVIILIVGYVKVFTRLVPRRRNHLRRQERSRERGVEWKDVGEEFKGAAYNLGRTIKESLEPEKKKKVKRKGKEK